MIPIYVNLFRYYFFQFWLKVVENKKEQKKKTCFILTNTKIAMNTKNKVSGIFLIILPYIE